MVSGKKKGKTDWSKLRAIQEAMPEPTESELKEAREFWKDADVIIPGGKTRMTVRFDTDLVEWFKSFGPKYQTRMNLVLRQFMREQQESHLEVSTLRSNSSMTEYMQALNQLGSISLTKGDLDAASKYFLDSANYFEQKMEVRERESGYEIPSAMQKKKLKTPSSRKKGK